ncbi:hypothetical protein KI387_021854, partial [Taxus chinensis]
IRVPSGPNDSMWKYPMEDNSLAKRFKKYTCDGITNAYKLRVDRLYRRIHKAFKHEWRVLRELPTIQDEFAVYQNFSL